MASTKIAKFFAHDHTYTPFDFSRSISRIANLQQKVYNCRRNQIANNESMGYFGTSIHALATRIAVTCLVLENDELRGVKMAWAIEHLTFTFTQSETLARAMASGVDLKIVQLPPDEKASIYAWFENKQTRCPKMLADLMLAQSWAVDAYFGFNALAEHVYENIVQPAFQVALEGFDDQWESLGEQAFIEAAQGRWIGEHSRQFNPSHISDFLHRVDLISDSGIQRAFKPLARLFPPPSFPSSFNSNGVLHQRFIFVAYLGFAVLDCHLGKQVVSWNPDCRVSISGAPAFGMALRQMVLCDESLAFVADKMRLCDFPPNCDNQAKAQALCAAVGQLYLDNPLAVGRTLDLPIGILVTSAIKVIEELDNDLLPRMSTLDPYPMVPLPYYDDTPFSRPSQNKAPPSPPPPSPPLPSPPSLSPSPPPPSSVAEAVVSPGVSLMSNIRKVAKVLGKPFRASSSRSTANASSPSHTSTSSTSTTERETDFGTGKITKSGWKGLFLKVRTPKLLWFMKANFGKPGSSVAR
ncbi:hypothetical protein ONZ45_g11846 [Pleurotus djamor]|nr:hypothetical protein ONZ45_g11846 [Pleurotus djamor]